MIANLTPFRGPSADAGTVYEVGFARALGRVVFGYTNSAAPFTQRTLDYASTHGGAIASPGRIWRDGDGLLIEQFRRFDNLMIEGGLIGSGGALVVPQSEPEDRWRDLRTFRDVRGAGGGFLNLSRAARGRGRRREAARVRVIGSARCFGRQCADPITLTLGASRLDLSRSRGRGYLPNRRFRCWNARTARRKSILRSAGHNTSVK